MKKRIISLALVLILAVSLLALPAEAVTPQQAYNRLKDLAMLGSQNGNVYSYAYSLNNGSEILEFVYDTRDGIVAICYYDSNDTFDVELWIPQNAATPYEGFGGFSAYGKCNFTLQPSTYTTSSRVNITKYSSGANLSGLYSGIQEKLNELLDITNTLLYQLYKWNITDLGFTKFYRHTWHAWNDGVVTRQPTCVSTGVRTYTCAMCGKQETETIPVNPNAHSWDGGVVTTQPTCTNPGVKTITCRNCHTTTTQTVPAKGHSWSVKQILRPATEDTHGRAFYVCTVCGSTKESDLCSSEIFIDAPARGSWSHNPIDWAVFNGITNGTSYNTFSPDKGCTRGQVVTFLWRAAGSPEPGSSYNPFTDVASTAYYYKPVLWAVEKGITNGMSASSFAPDVICTRGQVVTFLWRYEGQQLPMSGYNAFSDVPSNAFYYNAVLWAVENGITNGTTNTTFAPTATCTRAHVVTFLFRDQATAVG